MRSFDVVVVGAGPAGEVAAGRLAEGGLEVALVEDRLVGGECSYWACMPSKALLRPAEVLAEARRVPGAREAATGELDVQAVLDRRDEVIHDLDDAAQLPWLEDRGITLLRGRGRLTGERRVTVLPAPPVPPPPGAEAPAHPVVAGGAPDGEEVEARRAVVLASGSLPKFPPIPGLDAVPAWTNREATTSKLIPRSLLILGGGVVGVEMAQAYRTLGAEVTLVEGERRLLPREEEFACEEVTEALAQLGVDIRTGQRADRVQQTNGTIAATLSDGSSAQGEQLLVALGRTPDTGSLGLEDLGFAPGRPVAVDEHMRVPDRPWLYAVGDLNGRALFTHMGKYQARIAADHLLGRETALAHRGDGEGAPRVIFTDPQVAAVGLTLEGAQRAGLNVRAVDVPTSGNAGGSFYGRGAPGTSRFVVDEDREVLVGATFTGAEVSDFVHAATIAVVGEVPLRRLWHAVPPFPTRSEVWLKLLEAYAL
jgi:dihydrolipoamide dehydrogenase